MADEVLIFNLEDAPRDLGAYMAGPWREASFTVLAAGQALTLASDTVEYSVFIARGSGNLTLSSGEEFDLLPGSAFAFPRPGAGTMVAGDGGLEALVVSVALK